MLPCGRKHGRYEKKEDNETDKEQAGEEGVDEVPLERERPLVLFLDSLCGQGDYISPDSPLPYPSGLSLIVTIAVGTQSLLRIPFTSTLLIMIYYSPLLHSHLL